MKNGLLIYRGAMGCWPPGRPARRRGRAAGPGRRLSAPACPPPGSPSPHPHATLAHVGLGPAGCGGQGPGGTARHAPRHPSAFSPAGLVAGCLGVGTWHLTAPKAARPPSRAPLAACRRHFRSPVARGRRACRGRFTGEGHVILETGLGHMEEATRKAGRGVRALQGRGGCVLDQCTSTF